MSNFKDKLLSLAKEKLDEASEEMLARYLNSRGYNPETTTKDKKIAITKSNEFKKWLNDHMSEQAEEQEVDNMISEVLSKDASAGDWIHDFVHSDNPKFEGKSKAQRKKMALAAYYAKQRNEEVDLEEAKRPETDDVPFVTPENTTSNPHDVVKDNVKKSYGKLRKEMLGKAGTTSEEVEQVNEISAGLASRYLSKKHDRDNVQTGPNTWSSKKPTTIDKAMKSGASTVRALKIIQKKAKK